MYISIVLNKMLVQKGVDIVQMTTSIQRYFIDMLTEQFIRLSFKITELRLKCISNTHISIISGSLFRSFHCSAGQISPRDLTWDRRICQIRKKHGNQWKRNLQMKMKPFQHIRQVVVKKWMFLWNWHLYSSRYLETSLQSVSH